MLTNERMQARLERLIAKWRPIMGLHGWDIAIYFNETEALGSCLAKPRYEEAVLRFNLARIKKELPNTMAAYEELVVHELTHCLCWRESERCVSWVCRAILRARDAGKPREQRAKNKRSF